MSKRASMDLLLEASPELAQLQQKVPGVSSAPAAAAPPEDAPAAQDEEGQADTVDGAEKGESKSMEKGGQKKKKKKGEKKEEDSSTAKAPIKFGWIQGVYMRCLLNIWGVMLFLRLTWVIGQAGNSSVSRFCDSVIKVIFFLSAGLLEGLLLITLSNVVTVITTFSMSAVSTNGQIAAGGIYYMISRYVISRRNISNFSFSVSSQRSLGPEFGGAIGLMFTLANSIAVAMYTIGFCESLVDMLAQYIPGFSGVVDADNRVNDIRLVGGGNVLLDFIPNGDTKRPQKRQQKIFYYGKAKNTVHQQSCLYIDRNDYLDPGASPCHRGHGLGDPRADGAPRPPRRLPDRLHHRLLPSALRRRGGKGVRRIQRGVILGKLFQLLHHRRFRKIG